MPQVTYAVRPFEPLKRGLLPHPPIKALSPEHACRIAKRECARHGGAVALAMRGDPTLDAADEAIVIAVFGQVPHDPREAALAA